MLSWKLRYWFEVLRAGAPLGRLLRHAWWVERTHCEVAYHENPDYLAEALGA